MKMIRIIEKINIFIIKIKNVFQSKFLSRELFINYPVFEQ